MSQHDDQLDTPAVPAGVPIGTAPPTQPPQYMHPPKKVIPHRHWTITDVLDAGFFLLGTVLIVWLAWILFARDLTFSWYGIVYLVLFWLIVAYVGLPRLQEVLTRIYVPDYFIGRTVTGIGVLGDPVNIALEGSEDDIHAAMEKAGWIRADELTLRSSWGIIVSSVLRRSYPAAPVSPLMLFERQEAFAYEQEVDGSASQRHHVRFWPVPDGWMLPGGARVGWLAAATYDRRVGLSLFTLQVTHKIEADIDIERNYVVDTVRYGTPSVPVRIINHFATAFHTRNGGGDLVHTDGNLPVLDVTGVAQPTQTPVASPEVPHDARSRLGGLRLPPPVVLIAGFLIAIKVILAATGVVTILGSSGTAESGSRWAEAIAGAVLIALWVAVLLRHRWARTTLLLLCAADAIYQFVVLTNADRIDMTLLMTTSVSVLILVALSSTDSRRWVERLTD